jgi:hypothetical protein
MAIDSDAQADLELEAEAAERVTGGRKVKASTLKTRPAPSQTVPAIAPPTVTPDAPQTALPLLGGAECEPIHYGESSGTTE